MKSASATIKGEERSLSGRELQTDFQTRYDFFDSPFDKGKGKSWRERWFRSYCGGRRRNLAQRVPPALADVGLREVQVQGKLKNGSGRTHGGVGPEEPQFRLLQNN